MLKKVKKEVRKLMHGATRNSKIAISLLGLSLVKPLSLITGILLVPLLLDHLGTVKYGIWLLVNSIIGWAVVFDFGFSNGLRNKLGEALADNDLDEAKSLVSTTFVMIFCIACAIYAAFLLVFPFLDWTILLNAPQSLEQEIKIFVLLTFSFFILRLITGIIITVLVTDQRPTFAEFINTSAAILSLFCIYILSFYAGGSLIFVGLISSSLGALVPLVASIILFKYSYKNLSPSFKHIKLNFVSKIGSQGLQFFAIQVCAIVIFSTDNLIISQIFGPTEVVPYHISHKLFGYIGIVFGILLTPFWAAYNEAYHKNDVHWLLKTLKKMLILWGIIAVVSILLLSVSDIVYVIWIGNNVKIPLLMSFCMCLFVLFHTLNTIFVTFIFSTGKLRIQTYAALIAAIFNLPMSYFFSTSLQLGTSGVIVATVVCIAPNLILAPVQTYKLIHKSAQGIWAR